MDINERIASLKQLGEEIKDGFPEEILNRAEAKNPWFTRSNIHFATQGLQKYLDEENLRKWVENYPDNNGSAKNIGVIMAGNIPIVGVHDFLSVLVSGHNLFAKLSDEDNVLIPYLVEKLKSIDNRFDPLVTFTERMNDAEALIATGGDNSARYFEYYFREKPHIIRRNRTSLAILNGDESDSDLELLGDDIFLYFGLGCRNVSKLFLPEGYDLKRFGKLFHQYQDLVNHNKYGNNYSYRKSIMLVNKSEFLDFGFWLMEPSDLPVSPVSVVYYQFYKDKDDLENLLSSQADKIQCVVSSGGWHPGSFSFGRAQLPDLWNYADNVDTMDFLLNLN